MANKRDSLINGLEGLDGLVAEGPRQGDDNVLDGLYRRMVALNNLIVTVDGVPDAERTVDTRETEIASLAKLLPRVVKKYKIQFIMDKEGIYQMFVHGELYSRNGTH